MAVDEANVSKILSVLSHPLRRRILVYLNEKTEGSFTDFATTFSVDTGKLSFHLRSLEAFVEQTPQGKYKLSTAGQNAIILIKDLETWAMQTETATRSFVHANSNWKKRVAAYLIDFAIGFTLFFLLPNAFLAFTSEDLFAGANLVFFLVLFWIYLTLLEGFSGQTIGKLVAYIKVVGIDGKPISYDRAAVRNFATAFLLPIDLIIGWRMKDTKYIRYFDKFAGTTVIDINPKVVQSQATSTDTANQTSQS